MLLAHIWLQQIYRLRNVRAGYVLYRALVFQMVQDWKRARRPITKYTFPFPACMQSRYGVKNIASGKNLQRLLRNTNGGRPDNGVSVCEGD